MKHETLILYLHGKGGSAAEADHYRPLFPDSDVVGLDYKAQTPWDAKAEFPRLFQTVCAPHRRVILIANSIGAYFAMCGVPQQMLTRAYFISPLVDMEQLICDMLRWAQVTEAQLQEQQIIETAFGETLSWAYLRYVRQHPIDWRVPTEILYGQGDHLTSRQTITTFANAHSAGLTVMENGEHWFHTDEQMLFLDAWLTRCEEACRTACFRANPPG